MIQRRPFMVEYEYMESDKVQKVQYKVMALDAEEAKELVKRCVIQGATITITNVTEVRK